MLLLLKRNRSAQAWWVIGLSFGAGLALALLSGCIASPDVAGLLQIPSAMVLGLATVWLLSPYFDREVPLLTFLGTALAMELSSLFVVAVHLGSMEQNELVRVLASVAVSGLVLSLAFHLAGWSCRRRFDWRRLALWLGIWLLACWGVAFIVLSLLFGHGPLGEMALVLLITAVTAFALFLPFLLLSFINGFFRARLQAVLRLEGQCTS